MIYTLIAFSLMGLVLAFVVPKIEETQDKGIIEQSIKVLQDIDSLIRNLGGPGNQRTPEVGINKGSLTIDAVQDKIFFELESKYKYSEPGENVTIGKVIANTEERGSINIITLTLNYTGTYDLRYAGAGQEKTLSRAPVPYQILISDEGTSTGGRPIINMEVRGE